MLGGREGEYSFHAWPLSYINIVPCIRKKAGTETTGVHPPGERGGGGGIGCAQFVHGRSRMTIDPRIPTMPGRSTPGFHQPGIHCLHQPSAKRREVFGESHER